MYNCEIEFANINVSWRFPHIISKLPAPNTEFFDVLIKGLSPMGLIARSINLESPTANLDDVALVINLPSPELRLRISYSGIDMDVRNVEADEIVEILQVLNVVFETLNKIDSDIKKGNGNTRVSLHLKLLEKNINEYISERVSAKINNKNVKPEALVFTLDFDEITKHFPTTVTIASSLVVQNGLYLDLNFQSGKAAQDFQWKEPMEFFQALSTHYQTLLSLLELNPVFPEEN